MANRSERVLQVGLGVAGLGATFTAAYWIYALQTAHTKFLSMPGYVSIAVLVVGLVLTLAGLIAPSSTDPAFTQVQRGGRGSTNIQAGRDVNDGGKQ